MAEINEIALQRIEQAAREEAEALDLRGLGLHKLPEQLWNLKNLHHLRLGCLDLTKYDYYDYGLFTLNYLTDLPEWLGQLTQLQSLDLSYNNLSNLPEVVGRLSHLQSLDLSHNNLSELPEWLGNLKQLQSLNLSGVYLSELPEWLGNLKQLQSLNLSGVYLSELPEWLGQMTQLQSLNLSSNNLSELPEWLGQMIQLQSLKLSYNNLSELPEWLGQLALLQSLDISGVYLREFPEWLENLTQLQFLDFSSIEIPEMLSGFTNLHSLDLNDKSLSELPKWLENLTQLQFLNLSQNKLTELPKWLGNLTQLQFLDLSQNSLMELPEWLGNLTQMRHLNLSGFFLRDMWEWVGKLGQLQSLCLSGNYRWDLELEWLGQVPEELIVAELKYLKRMHSLDLKYQSLSEMPEWLDNLRQLQILDLSYNNLLELPEWFGCLTQLRFLDIRTFHLKGTYPGEWPKWMRNLTQLQFLNLSGYKLMELPEWLGNLTHLQILDLSHNNLTRLPEWLGDFTQIHTLNLSDNKLTELPEWLGQLTQLNSLDLSENNALPLPAELLRQSNPQLTLDAYFKAQGQQGRPLHEAKLLVVGQGRVGKTSLLRRLTDGSFDNSESTTHGINVRSRQISLPNSDVSVRLNLWDFGGQEIMHNTHQFFLTRRSLYLVVLNAREDAHANRLYYWLKLIGNIADAPIIVVINQIDQNPAFTLDERELRYHYPNIVAFARTNCEAFTCDDQAGFGSLETKIAQAINNHLPHINDRLPESYFKVKEELEQMETPTIQFATYQGMCQRHALEDENLQRGYMRVFYELGTVLNYQDDPHLANFGIMNRNWVVQGVYAILTTKLLADSRGRLQRSDLPAIFAACKNVNAADYPPHTYGLILDMMQKFELCYPFDSASSYLVPDLFDKTTPENVDFATLTEGSLAFRYEFEALPSSIFSRFLVRRHRLVQPGLLWHGGAVLRRDEQTAFIRSRADDARPSILINITGPGDRRPMLEIIRSTFEELFPHKMTVKEMVPLPKHPELALPYTHLRKMVARNIPSHYVPEIDDFISPGELLGVVEQEGRRSRRQADDSAPQRQVIINMGDRGDDISIGNIEGSSDIAVGRGSSSTNNQPPK